MSPPVLLSAEGSDRGTGYDLSHKLIRRGSDLCLGWLNAPQETGGSARVMLGVADVGNGALQGAVCLATGIDNHCGPALALEPGGRLHFMSGAHHGDFLHRWTDAADPLDMHCWSEPVAVGPRASYPSLICDPAGTLHLAFRSSRPSRWQLLYRRKPLGADWSEPVPLAESPTSGYCHFMQSLAADARGQLHLLFQFHYSESGHAADCLTYAAVHLRSRDGGHAWWNAQDEPVTEPVTITTAIPFCAVPQGGMRLNSLTLDEAGTPWVYVVHPQHPCGLLYALSEAGPSGMPPGPAMEAFDLRGGRSLAMAFDVHGDLHLLFAQKPDGQATDWFDPDQELHHARLRPGALDLMAPAQRLTGPDPTAAHWLPVIEGSCPIAAGPEPRDTLWYMWTQGLNQGGIGGDNANALKTRIWLSGLNVEPDQDNSP